MEGSFYSTDCMADLPRDWPVDLMPAIQTKVRAGARKVVVLDDDPTGTQTVHDIPVLTHWSVKALSAELTDDGTAFFILTNSRSLTADQAYALNSEIGANLKQAAERTGVQLDLISRSDSTLRGHFPGEVQALQEAMETPALPCLLIPFFLEGGRLTIDNIHYVADGDQLIPAAQTVYAQDATFGYRHSDLRWWIEEKTQGGVTHQQVASISLADIRTGGPQGVAQQLFTLPPASFCVINAVTYRDIEVVVAGLLEVEAKGRRFIFRTAASFVRVRAGVTPRGLLEKDELSYANGNGGLFVVGSYVPKTTAQLSALQSQTDIKAVEARVGALLEDSCQATEIRRVILEINRLLLNGDDVVLYTSRGLISEGDARHNLEIGRRVSDALIKVVSGIECRPRYLVAKGGITSSDLATKALQVRRAMVMGQVLPGVPVWKLGPEARYPDMAYIIFPGNVGDTDALVQIHRRLVREK